MMRRLPLAIALACAAFVLTRAGCGPGLGTHCLTTVNCADGLVCILPPNGDPAMGGACEPPGGGDLSTAGNSDLLNATD